MWNIHNIYYTTTTVENAGGRLLHLTRVSALLRRSIKLTFSRSLLRLFFARLFSEPIKLSSALGTIIRYECGVVMQYDLRDSAAAA